MEPGVGPTTLQAWTLVLQGYPDQALERSRRALPVLNTVRAIGDEPLPRSMMDRMLLHHQRIHKLFAENGRLIRGPDPDSYTIAVEMLNVRVPQSRYSTHTTSK